MITPDQVKKALCEQSVGKGLRMIRVRARLDALLLKRGEKSVRVFLQELEGDDFMMDDVISKDELEELLEEYCGFWTISPCCDEWVFTPRFQNSNREKDIRCC